MTSPVEPTELVAGAWQLRPWPAAYADLDDLLSARYGAPTDAERARRLGGWEAGDVLGFAVRDIATGAAQGEVLLLVTGPRVAAVDAWPASPLDGAREAGREAVTRWATAALGLDVSPACP